MGTATKIVTDKSFDTDVLKSPTPVLVDFWAEWCGPCKNLAPVLEQIASELTGQVTIAKINIDENPMAPSKYGIKSIPTMILFKAGSPVASKVGAGPKAAIESWIKGQL